ncbi:hypothetical protein F0562_035590 [Nyssa sinensis]|uniref:SWIM-type domain-containing protein n=1 Tax=Nyssa sinensis TaxID=561372 RepID=A0A5J5AD64_9ASTE|nr:hypothetical protein F0562_035590 [Nyssa sinensis]
MKVNNETRFDEFKSEIADMWECDSSSMTLKYFLPNNRRTLITLSSDKDMQNMIDFHEDSSTVDVYVMITQIAATNLTITHCSRSSETTAATETEPLSPIIPLPGRTSKTTAATETEPVSPIISLPGRSSETTATTEIEPFSPIISLPVFVADVEDVGKHTLTSSWKNIITGLGQRFESANDFRDALYKYSVAHGFLYKLKENSSKRVNVKCKAEGCPWHILTSRLSTTELFRIKKMNGTHTCGVGTKTGNGPRASPKLLASIVKEKLQHSLNCRPREIIDKIQHDYGIEVGYAQAWRGIEIAREELQGSHKEAYKQLPWLCEKILETNPGSVATVITKDDMSFHRIFVALHASIHGFQNGCRPLLFLDNMPLKSKYQEEMLIATALDGDDGVFPVAFAIVDVRSDDNWHWFLVQLEAVLSTSQSITFVADRKKGISDSIHLLFENCYHGYCLHDLTESLKVVLKWPVTHEVVGVIVAEVYNAAYAPTLDGFKKCIETIKKLSHEAYEWVLQSDPEHWANAFFKGARYNHVRSNIAESFYSWVSEQPPLPITQVIEIFCQKMMKLIHTRRVDSDHWLSRLTPSVEEKLQRNTLNIHLFEVLLSTGSNVYEVRDTMGLVNVVNLELWSCSCREWQITGLPCLHGVVVIRHFGQNAYDFCSKYFTVNFFRNAYSESINPVPTADSSTHSESSPLPVHPPSARRPIGRPKEKWNQPKGVVKRPFICSKCKKPGHTRLSNQTNKQKISSAMAFKFFIILVFVAFFSGVFQAAAGVHNLANLNSNASLLSGIELPDHSSFGAVSASAKSGCSLRKSKKATVQTIPTEEDEDDGDVEVSIRPQLHAVKLHLKHRFAGREPEAKQSVFESKARDLTRIQTLHTRIIEKKNQNTISRLKKESQQSGQLYNSIVARAPSPESYAAGFSGQLTATLESGVSLGSGEYFIDVFVGIPPKHFSLILDTGSDLNWIQCVPCYDCFEQNSPHYNPKDSSSFRNISCHDPRCRLVSSPDPPQPCKAENQTCPYYYWYGDSSNTTGDFAVETFTVNLTTPAGKSEFRQVENLMFGCGHWNRGLFHGAAGLLGLGRGPLSFSSQLQSLYGHSFSYCLVDRNSNTSVNSKLIFGEDKDLMSHPELNFTTLVEGKENTVETFYYVEIKSIVVGGEVLNIPEETWHLSREGAGGTIIDSGTTLSYFADPAYKIIKEAFEKKVKRYPKVDVFPILDPCYNVSGVEKLELPTFGILFSDGAVWNFPVENYFIRLEPDEVVCLAILGTPRSALSIIGNYQQQNFHILYDTKKSRLGFAPTKCADV